MSLVSSVCIVKPQELESRGDSWFCKNMPETLSEMCSLRDKAVGEVCAKNQSKKTWRYENRWPQSRAFVGFATQRANASKPRTRKTSKGPL